MYKIKALNEIAIEGTNLFSKEYSLGKFDDCDAILVRSANMLEYAFQPELKAIARAGVGVNNIPLEICAEKGIVVFNTPGANANAVKELVLASLIISSRELSSAIDWAKGLVDEKEKIPALVETGKSQFSGVELKGKTLGVIGLGAVGVLIANAANSLGMNVLGYDPYISVNSAWGLSRNVKRALSIDEVYSEADYITLHVPFIDTTKHLINKTAIKKMKTGVRLFNFARAELVDEEALLAGLSSNKVAKYITDFPNERTLVMPNTINIPHLGASTAESEINCAIMAVNEISDYLENGNIKNSVNYPDCDMGICSSDARLSINHRNIPNMVGQITAVMGQHKINIANMLNMSKKNWAYTLLDLEGSLSKEVITAISQIEGVVKVRKF
jgi:D-3-phosphoglycerate dehydrogenase / 2-oxoglutarate reductase